MRTPRVVIIAAFLFTMIILTCISFQPSNNGQSFSTKKAESSTGVRALFAFNTPLSLFPPNAIISLTDDNTTFFQARPAAFGPPLPLKGMDGELWIGSGFGADSLRQGGIVAGAEGELGCSDVPGWVDGNKKTVLNPGRTKSLPEKKLSKLADGVHGEKGGRGSDESVGDGTAAFGHLQARVENQPTPAADDGTDDYLHHHLVASKPPKPGKGIVGAISGLPADHADIQSIQEGAEISGKIVLLSRGGCGFLEKVKWVQRRGGVALIVGDDTKGGPLIQMYARGDTSNVTIPSVFTSWTTAHLLSKLIPSGPASDDAVDENGKPIKKPKKITKKPSKHGSQPAFDNAKSTPKGGKQASTGDRKAAGKTSSGGWFSSWFSKSGSKLEGKTESKTGRKDWIIVEEWDDSEDSIRGGANVGSKPASATKAQLKDTQTANKDGFIIGEQDWRDPDLLLGKPKVPTKDEPNKKPGPGHKGKTSAKPTSKAATKHGAEVKGGSITPGSGQYKAGSHSGNVDSKSETSNDKATGNGNSGLLTKIFGDDEDESDVVRSADKSFTTTELERGEPDEDDDANHDGLWITLTPTIGSSPFFDTLLVLVVSPLVTLSVVYALLLIRSRIRRRRWRAPKSVVERLPVRTFQTIRSVAHSRLPAPTTPTVTTPLLQDSAIRPRPRSQTTSGIPEPGELLRTNSGSPQILRAPSPRVPSRDLPEQEKGISSEWKKYMSKQVECVVCLEEYVDGVSRVMSLPCGHEFHVDCITPWLTTRRRTCPICKGDVVRSLARGSPSNPRYDTYHDDSDDNIQVQAAEAANTLPAAAIPVRTNSDGVANDLERGIISPTPSRPRGLNQAGSWRSLLSSSIASSSRSPRPTPEDRSR